MPYQTGILVPYAARKLFQLLGFLTFGLRVHNNAVLNACELIEMMT